MAPMELPRHRADELLSRLADQVATRSAASTIFGAPVERDGVTIVPVASSRFGFGAGFGEDRPKDQDGGGGGAGGMVVPLGHVELTDGRSRFVPVIHPARMLALLAGGVLAGLLILDRRER
jgi:uncharacterized spore protein YtfJ